jgi:diguanylate cyclase (GGDEF)-like protein/PAS domain S-box-containing protein
MQVFCRRFLTEEVRATVMLKEFFSRSKKRNSSKVHRNGNGGRPLSQEGNLTRHPYFTGLLAKTNVVIWSYDFVTGRMACSSGIEQLTGYRASDFETGKRIWQDLVFEEDRPGYEEKRKRANRGENIHHQYRIADASGTVRWVEEFISPKMDENQRVVRLDGFVAEVADPSVPGDPADLFSFHDPATGLGNRKMLEAKIASCLQDSPKRMFAVLLFQFDKLKSIAEVLGVKNEQKLLKILLDRLQDMKIPYDHLYRLDSTVFGLFLPNIRDEEEPKKTAQRMIANLEAPVPLENYEFLFPVKIGISRYPNDGSAGEELINRAEIALNHAEDYGEERIKFYFPAMDIEARHVFQTEADLKKAIRQNELTLLFQPKVNAKNNAIVGAEALVRWNHPERGLIPADQFIRIAEKSELIDEIGDWVLKQTCKILADWTKRKLPAVPISINISPKRFLKGDYPGLVRNVIRRWGIDPGLLEIEITETSLMENKAVVTDAIQQIRQLGIKFSLDDFGTGFSSINYLKQFRTIDTLKIDKSFIAKIDEDPQMSAIVKSFIMLAKGLDMEVIAEGVETAGQLKFLTDNDCPVVQGFIYSKPLFLSDFEGLLREGEIRPKIGSATDIMENDRRGYFRVNFPSRKKGWLTVKAVRGKSVNAGKAPIDIKNIGGGGLCFLSDLDLPAGNQMLLAFGFELKDDPFVLNGHIIWKKKLRKGFEYGAEFIIDENERARLIKDLNQVLVSQRHLLFDPFA